MRRLASSPSFLLYCLTTLFSPSIGGDTLNLDHPLADDGRTLISVDGSFELGFFSPIGSNNRYIGIWYHKIPDQTVVWVANRQRPVTGRHGSLSMVTNGTLIIRDENSTFIWSSSSTALADPDPAAQLLDNGNFVVKMAGSDANDPNSFAWQSFDYPTDTLLPGMRLGWNLTTGFNRQLSSWTSASDPASGDHTFGIDLHGDPQIFVWSGTRQMWREGPWNGLRFTGVPDMQSYTMFRLQFIVDADQVVYTFYMIDPSFVSRLVINLSGTLQRFFWVEQSQYWNAFWSLPTDRCDELSLCGPNGVCDTTDSPMCSCLQGFQPKNPSNWAYRDGMDGCVRRTALDCKNGTDGFNLVSDIKLPDTSNSTVDWSMSLEQCKMKCLKNCSCTAYAQANISGSGSGCIMWTTNLTDLRLYGRGGQGLYVRLAAADLGTSILLHVIASSDLIYIIVSRISGSYSNRLVSPFKNSPSST